jgi:phosphoglycolate phosphatase
MSITTVLFDLDGTLVDSLEDLTDAVNHVRTSFSLPLLTVSGVCEMVGKGAANLIQQVLPSSSNQERERALQLFIDFNTEHIVDKSFFYPGVVEMLTQLHAAGITMAVISNKHESLSRLILHALGIHDLFDNISGGDTFSEKKPSPLPLLSVMELLGSSPEQSCMVGDSINDIEAGNAAGITTIGCRWGYGTAEELYSATHLADSVSELVTILESLSTSGSRGTC